MIQTVIFDLNGVIIDSEPIYFCKFVRPNARRIDGEGGTGQLNFVAFKNENKTIILNVINNEEPMNCKINWNRKSFIQSVPSHSITTLKWNAAIL